ncbi:FUSC family protein [Streptomyces sp. S465]|uniref:FUSC family protein n=1 Tax=Streptomyces sp. S465 TaxID=2979468 RepID=UPI0022A86AC3|nr:FUSC family protein [Streptomyces sp. S465]WAP54894.1 FUSC family protein [Streptomyces sp. S465]
MHAGTMWWSSVAHTLAAATRVERRWCEPRALARATVALVAGSVIGWAIDDRMAWAMMMVGTFICGICTILPATRNRFSISLISGAAFTAAVFAGVYLHELGWWVLPVLFVGAYVAGLWRAFGVVPGIRACLVVIGAMITADLSPGIDQGLIMARWIAVGAGMVVVAQFLPPYGPRHHNQRRTLAALYGALAGYAAAGSAGRLPSTPFTLARTALGVLPAFARRPAGPLFALYGAAEEVRRALKMTAHATDVPRTAVAATLNAVAAAVRSGRATDLDTAFGSPARELEHWRGAEADLVLPRLAEALDIARYTLRRSDRPGEFEMGEHHLVGFPAGAARFGRQRLAAELRPGAPLFMNSIRLAVGAAAGEAIGRWIGDFGGHGLPSHGFWAALTTILVLFPDYGHTLTRGWGRSAGSVIGGVAAWVLLLPDVWNHDAMVVAATVLALLAFYVLLMGQWVLNIFITAWIVFLIGGIGLYPAAEAAWGRAADTVVGALVGMVIFLVLPTYHHNRLPELLARWVEAQRDLFGALLEGYARVGAVDPAGLGTLRDRARQTRERLEAAIGSLAHEPRSHRARWSATELAAIQSAVFDVGRAAALVYGNLPRTRSDAVPETALFAAEARDHLDRLAEDLALDAPLRTGDLREAFDRVASDGRLAQLTDPTAPDGISHARSRALTACLQTVTSVERLERVAMGRAA